MKQMESFVFETQNCWKMEHFKNKTVKKLKI